MKVRRGGEDSMSWKGGERSLFLVKAFYKVLLAHGCASFQMKAVWAKEGPPRLRFFVWTAYCKQACSNYGQPSSKGLASS